MIFCLNMDELFTVRNTTCIYKIDSEFLFHADFKFCKQAFQHSWENVRICS